MTPPPEGRRARARRVLQRRRTLYWLAVGLVVVSVAAYFYFSGRETTDNARIEGHVHPSAARVEGTVAKVHVGENDPVEAGQVLLEIDPRDFEIALRSAEADLAAAKAAAKAATSGVPITDTGADSRLKAARAEVERARIGIELEQQASRVAEQRHRAATATLAAAEAESEMARREVERLRPLVEKDQVARKRFEDAEETRAALVARAESRRAEVAAAEQEVAMARSRQRQSAQALAEARSRLDDAGTAPEQKQLSRAQAGAAQARVEQARARLERARLDLEYTQVKAPAAGVVSRKSVEVGQVVRAGQPVLAVVALDEVWGVANFKETQLHRMRPGQRAKVRVDAYPGLAIEGRVESLGAATGSRFSLLPADNATGNFVKVVQRVPVKIAFDQLDDPERQLLPGMSLEVEVVTRGEGATTGTSVARRPE